MRKSLALSRPRKRVWQSVWRHAAQCGAFKCPPTPRADPVGRRRRRSARCAGSGAYTRRSYGDTIGCSRELHGRADARMRDPAQRAVMAAAAASAAATTTTTTTQTHTHHVYGSALPVRHPQPQVRRRRRRVRCRSTRTRRRARVRHHFSSVSALNALILLPTPTSH